MELKNRLSDVDIVKAIGIIMMIIGHVDIKGPIDFYIHSFHMPLFFIMSGYLYRDKGLTYVEFTKKKARTLLVPYFVIAMLHYFIKIPYIIYTKDDLINPITHIFFDNSDHLPIAGGLWFLCAIFWSYELFYFIRRIKSVILQGVITCIIVICGYFVSKMLLLPWSIEPGIVCLGFMYLGKLVRDYGEAIIDKSFLGYFYLITGIVSASFNNSVNVRLNEYGNPLLFYVSAVFIVFGILSIVKREWKTSNFIVAELKFIGCNSLVYMCFNQLIVWFPNKVLSKFSGANLVLLKVLEVGITLIILRILALALVKSRIWGIITGRQSQVA